MAAINVRIYTIAIWCLLALSSSVLKAQNGCPTGDEIIPTDHGDVIVKGWPYGSVVYFDVSGLPPEAQQVARETMAEINSSPGNANLINFVEASGAMLTFRTGMNLTVDPVTGQETHSAAATGMDVGTDGTVVGADVSIDLGNLGNRYFDQSQDSNYRLAIKSVIYHEIGHTMGLGDVPIDSNVANPPGGQPDGSSVMNGFIVSPDTANNIDPFTGQMHTAVSFSSCDTTQLETVVGANNSGGGGDGGGGGCGATGDQYQIDGGTGDPCSPIIIDLDGGGFWLTSASGGVDFDITGSGHKIRLGWTATGSTNVFLVLDRNGNGLIDNGSELFGNFTPQPASANPNGWAALAEFDRTENGGNTDGVIDSKDAVFAKLRLWRDDNHDGISQPEELHTLPELGVFSISLAYKLSGRQDVYGNEFRYRGRINSERFVPGDNSEAGPWAYDVFLVTLQTQTVAARRERNELLWDIPKPSLRSLALETAHACLQPQGSAAANEGTR